MSKTSLILMIGIWCAIVGCEDDNPANPEIYATCFTNFIAMSIGQYLEKGQEADTKEAQCP